MADFKKLHVWRKAHAMALNAHRVAGRMRGARSGLRNQLLRAAMSVPTNIVEGSAKHSDREFARFVRIALGSLSELEYHLIIGHDTCAVSQLDFQALLDQLTDIRKMLTGLLKRLEMSASVAEKKADQQSRLKSRKQNADQQ